MKVKTASLKNNLSRYLAAIQKTGETIIVCDRNKPIATLAPIAQKDDEEWTRRRKEILDKAKARGWSIELPVRRPSRNKKFRPVPTIAPDRRTDIHTIDLVRKGRDY